MSDIYDYGAPDFTPNEWNSLRLHSETPQDPEDLYVVAEKLTDELHQMLHNDTAAVVCEGSLYIVGDYIRTLIEVVRGGGSDE